MASRRELAASGVDQQINTVYPPLKGGKGPQLGLGADQNLGAIHTNRPWAVVAAQGCPISLPWVSHPSHLQPKGARAGQSRLRRKAKQLG